MFYYQPAGEVLHFTNRFPELEPFEQDGTAEQAVPFVPPSFLATELISTTLGLVANLDRTVELHRASGGFLLNVQGGSPIFITANGDAIAVQNLEEELSQLDREIILGSALVLALALRGIWSLHASAAMFRQSAIAFLGESGQGKSTLANYLSRSTGWRLVADDILPLTLESGVLRGLPHFPQLKLPLDAQPGVDLPGHLPLKFLCVLTPAEAGQPPHLQKLSTAETVQPLLTHIAGTRMFDASLLARHLEFSTRAAGKIPAYWLSYPRRLDVLPLVRETLEKIC